MQSNPIHYYCGETAIENFLGYCQEHRFERFILICDENTYPVLGERVESQLRERGYSVRTARLHGAEVTADEDHLVQVLLHADEQPCTYLAIGSGTITDITRFCSHRTRNLFISLPTAPSVDGFASVIAAIGIRRFKDTIRCQPPVAIFADIQTLCKAPSRMIAAGFGDILGKFTSLADWKLAQLLWDEPYTPVIANRMEKALMACVENAAEIQKATQKGISCLMNGLVESGICMLLNGNSRPASGSEHHLSHFWEMKLLRQGRPAVLHGAKVGIGTVQIARRYEKIRSLSREQAALAVNNTPMPDSVKELQKIESSFGPITSNILLEQKRFLELTLNDYAKLRDLIIQSWDEILEIAAGVPSEQQIVDLLDQVGGPVDITGIGMNQDDLQEALQYAHYLRSQFTVTKLGRMLGLWYSGSLDD
jgi:glycerol-1-phosphate dehydrogenase [NAD(P)+]